MKVIIINPWDRSVSHAEHTGDFRDYYRLMSGPTLDGLPDAEVGTFDIVGLGDTADHVMFVDDEGLFAEPQAYFGMGNCASTYAGRGVIAGRNDDGDNADCALSLAQVAASVRWLPLGTIVDPGRPVVESFDTAEAMFEAIERQYQDRPTLIFEAPGETASAADRVPG